MRTLNFSRRKMGHFALAAPALVHMADYHLHANTLTNLTGALYAGLDVVSREQVGFIPSVSRDASLERAAVNQVVTFPISPPAIGVDIVPAMVTPTAADIAMGTGTIQITKARAFPFGFVGEEQVALNNGVGYNTVQADLFAQGLRGITNEIESDIGLAAVLGASRAVGTPGTTPFAPGASSQGDLPQVRKILQDNGAPMSDLMFVGDTAAGANIRSVPQFQKVNEAGTAMTLRDGELLNLAGFSIKESAGVKTHVKGTGASATTSTAGFAVGSTVIALASAGTGNILAGDSVTFAGDTNVYQIVSGDADTSNGGSITIAEPGLRVAIPAAATNITIGNTYVGNVGFSRSALQLVMRAPARPVEGDARLDSMMLTDPRSGLVFEVSVWPGYRMVRFEVAGVWGTAATKRAHIALLRG